MGYIIVSRLDDSRLRQNRSTAKKNDPSIPMKTFRVRQYCREGAANAARPLKDNLVALEKSARGLQGNFSAPPPDD